MKPPSQQCAFQFSSLRGQNHKNCLGHFLGQFRIVEQPPGRRVHEAYVPFHQYSKCLLGIVLQIFPQQFYVIRHQSSPHKPPPASPTEHSSATPPIFRKSLTRHGGFNDLFQGFFHACGHNEVIRVTDEVYLIVQIFIVAAIAALVFGSALIIGHISSPRIVGRAVTPEGIELCVVRPCNRPLPVGHRVSLGCPVEGDRLGVTEHIGLVRGAGARGKRSRVST